MVFCFYFIFITLCSNWNLWICLFVFNCWWEHEMVDSLLCHCPPWKPPDAGKQKAFPQCEAAPASQSNSNRCCSSYYYRSMWCDPVTWWSLSFSSQMILSTSLLLSFFTVCTSADVDRCCLWESQRGINARQRLWADVCGQQQSSRGTDIHLDQTQCIQAEVEISKKEERCRRVARVWYPTGRQDRWKLFKKMWLQTMSNSFNKIMNETEIAIYQKLMKIQKCPLLDEEDFVNSLTEKQIWPVDDVSESLLAVSWVNGGTGVAGNQVGGIVEQVDVDQVQTSAEKSAHSTWGEWGEEVQLHRVCGPTSSSKQTTEQSTAPTDLMTIVQ